MSERFSWPRIAAVIRKEAVQMRRDRLTLAMIVGVPLMQLFLFGFAINVNPKHLPTAVSIDDPGPLADSVVAALENSSYFEIVKATNSPEVARRLLDEGRVSFVVEIPQNFSRDLVRGLKPSILVEADATDPAASANATGALQAILDSALRDDLVGPLAARAIQAPSYSLVLHPLYNPESITQYNVVPGLLAVILTMSMVLMTCLALTRERERGTYENLLAMPVTPVELMIGKIAPNIVVGAVQSALVLCVARYVFGVPMIGSLA
ncbi:MAG: ABC transporter permease, partial [Alphaproteobacteria bacterium]|nr:ABC transporter permease [Alphaproteobacteria bacterium]